MKELTLSSFLNSADDYVCNAAIGEDTYVIKASSNKAVLISEAEWKRLQALDKQANKKENNREN